MSDDDSIKIILLGESGVGKTNLINISLDREFEQNSTSTIHSSYLEGILDYNNKKYTYALWDTAGQEIYRSLNKIFIKGSKIILFVYAINNDQSFKEIEYWINSAKEALEEGKYVMALVGNKSDLYEDQQVPDDKAKEFADKYHMKLEITSALSDQAGFKHFLKELIIDYIESLGSEEEDNNLSLKLRNPGKQEKKKNKCC